MMMTSSPSYVHQDFCEIFGDWQNGAKVFMGGLGDASTVDKQWYCPTRAVARYYMECEHGHKGNTMKLCRKHYNEFNGKVTFCPRCNQDERTGHKCRVVIRSVS